MAIDANIVNFGQSTPVADALSGLGSSVAGAITANKQTGLAENRKLAAGYLAQAFSDDSDEATTSALIEQAQQADPEFTLATMNQLGIGQAKSNIDQQKLELRRMEIDARNLERAAKEETNALKRAELENKLELQKQKIIDAKSKSEIETKEAESSSSSAKEQVETTLSVVDDLLDSENLDDIIGTIGLDILPTVRGESQDLINKAKRLNSLLTVDNLSKMSGILTDKDIELLKDIASGLNVTDKGIKGSPGGVRARLNEIKSKLSKKVVSSNEEASSSNDKVINWSDL